MIDLTAIVLTKNEEKNIRKCILSLKGTVTRVIIIDSFSTDKTVQICKELGAEVYEHPFENHAAQFNWALENSAIKDGWVLRIDADEELTPEICTEIKEAIGKYNSTDINGLVLRRRNVFMGRWIKYGGVYPIKLLRVFKYGHGKSEMRKMDEHIILTSGKTITLKNDFIHNDFKDIDNWITKHNWYSNKEIAEYFELISGQKNPSIGNAGKHWKIKRWLKNNLYYNIPLFIRPLLYFVYRYFLRLGFLDGKEGLIFHFLQAFWYRFVVDAKIFEHSKLGMKNANSQIKGHNSIFR